MTIKTTELLKLLTKVEKLGFSVEVREDKAGDYEIRIFELYSPKNFDITLVITQTCEKTWDKGEYYFDNAMERLDLKLEEQEQKRIKAEKRKELIARLTPEERKLLDLK